MASEARVAPADRGAALLFAVAVASIAWVLLLHHPHGPGFAGAFATWNLMMVAMMLPSLLPWLFLFERDRLALFLSGYFAIWAAYCAAAAFAQVTLRARFLLDAGLALPPPAGGALLVLAGLFELTPLKQNCLRHCRSPVGYFLARWQSGRGWAFRVGLEHGLNCLGCCWALMALGFALGVMNLGWMVALSLVLVVEKVLPSGERVSRWLAVALVLWGVLLIAAPLVPR